MIRGNEHGHATCPHWQAGEQEQSHLGLNPSYLVLAGCFKNIYIYIYIAQLPYTVTTRNVMLTQSADCSDFTNFTCTRVCVFSVQFYHVSRLLMPARRRRAAAGHGSLCCSFIPRPPPSFHSCLTLSNHQSVLSLYNFVISRMFYKQNPSM